MDSITQAVLGAAVAEAMVGKKIGRTASVIGAIGGTIPDLDIVVYPLLNDLEKISFHRGYSHSILFCLLAAFIGAYLFRYFRKTKILEFKNAYLCMMMVFITHVLLDSLTSYGTQLLLPFSDNRISLDLIGIIDPFYTLPLLFGLIISYFFVHSKKSNPYRPLYLGLIISTFYLVYTPFSKNLANREIKSQMVDHDISTVKYASIPVYAGNFKWYGVAVDRDSMYLGKFQFFDQEKIDFHSFPVNDHLLDELDPILAERMKWFANGFYTLIDYNDHIRIYNLQVDMQGVKKAEEYTAPTGFYFEMDPSSVTPYIFSTGVHQ